MTIYRASHPPPKVELQAVCELREADREQVLSLLAQDPVRSVILRGLILDYGMCAPELRGVFYGYFTDEQLTGVALIGHQLIVFAADDALASFAQKAVEVQARLYMILAPEQQVEKLWAYLSQFGRETRRTSAQRSYVCQQSGPTPERRQLLRPIMPNWMWSPMRKPKWPWKPVVLIHVRVTWRASAIALSSGWNANAFGSRSKEGKVIFKAEILSDTPDTVYLEGIWTHPEYRNRGIAKSCMAELVSHLLRDHQTICLFTDETEQTAQRVYEQVGFHLRPLIKRASSLRQCL